MAYILVFWLVVVNNDEGLNHHNEQILKRNSKKDRVSIDRLRIKSKPLSIV